MTICKGNEVDSYTVVEWYVELMKQYNVRPFKFGFDNWHAASLKKGLAAMFGEDTLVRVGMNFFALNNPMSVLETDLMTCTLNFGNNEVTAWCLRGTSR